MIFIKYTFLGHPLKRNIFIIAACNPYRLIILSDSQEIGYINKKMPIGRNLMYAVNPLPFFLINYIFDFGNVKNEDEKKNIRIFIDIFLNDIFYVKNSHNYSHILEIPYFFQ